MPELETVGAGSHRARGVTDPGAPAAAAGSGTSFTAPVSRAVGEYLSEVAAGLPRTASVEFVELGSSGYISDSMLEVPMDCLPDG